MLIQTLDTIHANFNTSDSVYRDYKQLTHTLPLDYAGRDYILRFRTTAAKAGRFRIDNAFVAYEGVPTADLIVDVDEAEGSPDNDVDLGGDDDLGVAAGDGDEEES